ncbi:hypothetical protein [Kitasatospora sp. NPDC057223]|uniref:hypothetical protein n=1 Tax=Kitasatospora sp. NPDC057223 TaxID=3346055 RepID=UPI003637CB37
MEKLIERLSPRPRLGIPVPGGTDPEVDDYTARTDPAADSGDRISIVFPVKSACWAELVPRAGGPSRDQQVSMARSRPLKLQY